MLIEPKPASVARQHATHHTTVIPIFIYLYITTEIYIWVSVTNINVDIGMNNYEDSISVQYKTN